MTKNFVFIILFVVGSSAAESAAEQLSWQDCLWEASKNQPDLIAAHEAVIQSQADKKIAGSGAWPALGADLNASSARSSVSGSSRNFSYGGSANQLFFDGLKTINNVRAADETINAVQFAFKFTSSDTRLQLRQAFVNLLKAQELVSLTEQIYGLRKSNLELITLRYESGTEHKGALLTAKANLSEAVFEINSAKRGLEAAQRQLIKGLGRRTFLPITAQGDLSALSFENTAPAYETLAEKNPSILKIISQKNAASFDVKAKWGEFWPSVVLNGGALKTGHSWPPGESEISAGVAVTLPLFSGGANVARLAKAQSVYRQLEQQERSVRDGVVLALQMSWNGLADAVEKVQVQKDFLAAAEERAKIAQAQYTVGLVTFDNWTIIEDDLVSNRKIFLDVQAAALIAEANWIKAQGGTLEYEN